MTKQSINQSKTVRRPPNTYKVISFLIGRGSAGISELEVVDALRLPNARNYLTELERKAGLKLGRKRFQTQTGTHFTRYFIQNKEDAQKVLTYLSRFKVELNFNSESLLNKYKN